MGSSYTPQFIHLLAWSPPAGGVTAYRIGPSWWSWGRAPGTAGPLLAGQPLVSQAITPGMPEASGTTVGCGSIFSGRFPTGAGATDRARAGCSSGDAATPTVPITTPATKATAAGPANPAITRSPSPGRGPGGRTRTAPPRALPPDGGRARGRS